jgi:hypothetical protein
VTQHGVNASQIDRLFLFLIGFNLRGGFIHKVFVTQYPVKFVKGYTKDLLRINQHFARPPLQAITLGVVETGITANDQQGDERDVPMAKGPCEPVGLLVIIKVIKPVHDLTEAVVKTRVPLRVSPSWLILENTVGRAVFKLNNTEMPTLLVTENQIRLVVAEEAIFKLKFGGWPQLGRISPKVRG